MTFSVSSAMYKSAGFLCSLVKTKGNLFDFCEFGNSTLFAVLMYTPNDYLNKFLLSANFSMCKAFQVVIRLFTINAVLPCRHFKFLYSQIYFFL